MFNKRQYEGDLHKNDYNENIKRIMRWVIVVLVLIALRIILWLVNDYGRDIKKEPDKAVSVEAGRAEADATETRPSFYSQEM